MEEKNVLFTGIMSIVGMVYYSGEANFDDLVNFIQEPQNQYDKYAVRVENIDGKTVGYVKKADAEKLTELITNKKVQKTQGRILSERNRLCLSMRIEQIFIETS